MPPLPRISALVTCWAIATLGLVACSRETPSTSRAAPPPSTSPATPAASVAAPSDATSAKSVTVHLDAAEVVILYSTIGVGGESRPARGVVVHATARLENRTGRPLGVLSNFSSVFDGFSIVLRAPGGKELKRTAYVAHQSPFAEDRELPLPTGTTRMELQFHFFDWRDTPERASVFLVGGLRGTAFAGGLRSNELPVEISPH